MSSAVYCGLLALLLCIRRRNHYVHRSRRRVSGDSPSPPERHFRRHPAPDSHSQGGPGPKHLGFICFYWLLLAFICLCYSLLAFVAPRRREALEGAGTAPREPSTWAPNTLRPTVPGAGWALGLLAFIVVY